MRVRYHRVRHYSNPVRHAELTSRFPAVDPNFTTTEMSFGSRPTLYYIPTRARRVSCIIPLPLYCAITSFFPLYSSHCARLTALLLLFCSNRYDCNTIASSTLYRIHIHTHTHTLLLGVFELNTHYNQRTNTRTHTACTWCIYSGLSRLRFQLARATKNRYRSITRT